MVYRGIAAMGGGLPMLIDVSSARYCQVSQRVPWHTLPCLACRLERDWWLQSARVLHRRISEVPARRLAKLSVCECVMLSVCSARALHRPSLPLALAEEPTSTLL